MRIPSGFNDGSLYRTRNRKTPVPSPYRGLLRLILALVLVLVAMRQAANPELFRVFFTEPQSYSPPSKPKVSADLTGGSDEAGDDGSAAPTTSSSAINPRRKTIGALTESDRDALATALMNDRKATPDFVVDDSLVKVVRAAADLADESFTSSPVESPLGDAEEKASLQAGLDDFYLDQVSDGSLWKQADLRAFTRLLEDGIEQSVYLSGNPQGPPKRVGVVPLLQQPSLYLRTRVAIGGQLARVSFQEARDNPFGIKGYYELWLEPDDGSRRPVAFYTATLPQSFLKYVGVSYLTDGPAMVVEGVYLKRLAFRSSQGSELAPVLVGGMYVDEVAEEKQDAQKPSVSIVWLFTVSAVIGIGIAVVIFVTTTRAARKSRQQRLATQQFEEPKSLR